MDHVTRGFKKSEYHWANSASPCYLFGQGFIYYVARANLELST